MVDSSAPKYFRFRREHRKHILNGFLATSFFWEERKRRREQGSRTTPACGLVSGVVESSRALPSRREGDRHSLRERERERGRET